MSLLDLFIMLPTLILIEPVEGTSTYFLIPFSRYLRAMIFVIILSRYFKLGQTDVDRQINIVFMTMVLLAYISSGMYAIVENIKRGKDSDRYLQFHDSVYFVIVSLATVGYGDEIPSSEFGRVIVLFIILFTIVLIPAQTNELLRLIQIRSRYRRIEYKSVDVRHIVVTGSVDL
jgi:Ion channel